jgi:hypothetical protein
VRGGECFFYRSFRFGQVCCVRLTDSTARAIRNIVSFVKPYTREVSLIKGVYRDFPMIAVGIMAVFGNRDTLPEDSLGH